MSLLLPLVVFLPVGCDSTHRGNDQVEGYWKGEMIMLTTLLEGKPPQHKSSIGPKRILMKLQQSKGQLHGEYAEGLDVVGFAGSVDQSWRPIARHAVSGTITVPSLRLSFRGDSQRSYQVEATIAGNNISGTYLAGAPPDETGASATESGTFKLKRY